MKKSGSAKPTKVSGYWDIKTFTYFIAAPLKRKNGYREREFDKIIHGILDSGHSIIDWSMQAISGDTPGLYVIFILGSTKKNAQGPALDIQEKFALSNKHQDPHLEFLDDD